MRFFLMGMMLYMPFFLCSQSSYIDPHSRSRDIHDRYEILSDIESPVHTGLQGYKRKELTSFFLMVSDEGFFDSEGDIRSMQYVLEDNTEWLKLDTSEFSLSQSGNYERIYQDSNKLFYTIEEEKILSNSENDLVRKKDGVFNRFYKTQANLYELNTKYFNLKLNPIVNIRFGKDLEDDDRILFQNTRGLRLRGDIDGKVYFYTDLQESQGNFFDYIEARINRYQAIPGFGSYKNFESSVSDRFTGFDFPRSTAYVGVNVSKHIDVELGHGRHFIGHGYNSLLLSDYANNYFYLKFNTRVWKFHYQNIFAELNPISSRENPGDVLLPKKYMAAHYISFKPFKDMEIGLFEAVVFARENQFEFQYLNPVILYRTVEFNLDSPDNVLIGLNGKWNLFNRFSLYGQLVLDEFKLNEIKDRSGWWANKYGLQLGLKYINVLGVDHLDGQVEYNVVRPYTYGQRRELPGFPNRTVSSYSHFNQPLAHPLGANFREFLGIIRYGGINKLSLTGKAIFAQYGDSTDGVHWGNDILVSNDDRIGDFNNVVGQGVKNNVTQLSLLASYELYHNYYIDLDLRYRTQDSEDDNFDFNTTYVGGGIRVNMENLKIDY